MFEKIAIDRDRSVSRAIKDVNIHYGPRRARLHPTREERKLMADWRRKLTTHRSNVIRRGPRVTGPAPRVIYVHAVSE